MYSSKRIYLSKHDHSTTQRTIDFSPNENGIYVPNNNGLYIPNGPKEINEQNLAFARYSYTKYPSQLFKEKIKEHLSNISVEEGNKNLQIVLQNKTEQILKNVKDNIRTLDQKFITEPIKDQIQIPKFNDISEISKALSIFYVNIYDKKFIQDLNPYISTKSFFHLLKESPHLKKELREIDFHIFNKIIININNLYTEASILNLKKALYPLDSSMPFYFLNESGLFRDKEFLQTIECVHSNILPGNYYIKTLKGSGDLYYKDAAQPDFLYVELKTADLPESHMDHLLKNIPIKYHMIKNLIICFDVKSQDQQDQITNYLIKHKISNVTSIFINNSKFFSDHQLYNYGYALKNPLDNETLDFFYNSNFKKKYMINLEEVSKKNRNKIDLSESEEKLDQLVDPKVLDIIEEYQKVGNIFELINPAEFLKLEFNDVDINNDF